MKEKLRFLFLLSFFCTVCGCDANMGLSRQDSFKSYERPEALQGKDLRPPASEKYSRSSEPDFPPLDMQLLEEGQKYYLITCRPCHGTLGRATGEVLAHGFLHPPKSFLEESQKKQSVFTVYHTLTDGRGEMLSVSDQLNRKQRWAVANYVKVLQKLPLPPSPTEVPCVE